MFIDFIPEKWGGSSHPSRPASDGPGIKHKGLS